VTDGNDKIIIKRGQREYSAVYRENSGVVTVTMTDDDGTPRGCSTFINGLSAESVARTLFGELLKDLDHP